MEEIGHYRIRGKAKSQRNWRIYAGVENNKGMLRIEDYKNKGELFFAMDGKFLVGGEVSGMHGFATFNDLSLDEFAKVLVDAENFYRGKYKSLRWFLDTNKVSRILVILRLKQ